GKVADSKMPMMIRYQSSSFLLIRSVQHTRDASIRGSRSGHDVTHESDNDDRENQNRQVAVEGREIAKAHRSQNHETSAQREDHERREIRAENDHGDQAGEQAQDAQTNISGFCIRGDEFFVLIML